MAQPFQQSRPLDPIAIRAYDSRELQIKPKSDWRAREHNAQHNAQQWKRWLTKKCRSVVRRYNAMITDCSVMRMKNYILRGMLRQQRRQNAKKTHTTRNKYH